MIINVSVPVAQCCYIEVMQELDSKVQIAEFSISFHGAKPIHSELCKLRQAEKKAEREKENDDKPKPKFGPFGGS